MRGTPSLDDALIGDEFDISSDDHPAKHGKSTARCGVDICRHAGEGGELLRIEKNLVDPLRAGLQFDFLVKRGASLVCRGAPRFFGVLLLLRQSPKVPAADEPGQGGGSDSGDHLAAC